MDDSASPDSVYSSLREKIVEHLFLGDVLRELWNQERYSTEVSRAESDSFGYDLVIETGRIIRHIQLKSRRGEKPKHISIAKSLADKPSGCVVVIMLSSAFEMESFPVVWRSSRSRARHVGIVSPFQACRTRGEALQPYRRAEKCVCFRLRHEGAGE